MAKARIYTWFLEPSDSHTNEVFSREISEENLNRDIVCGDGRRRTLWVCDVQTVSMFWRSRQDLKIRFKIFCQEGHGKPRECTFLFYKRKSAEKQRVST